MVQMQSRFYYETLPDLEDTVMAKVTKIADMGAYVTLLEYNNKGCLISQHQIFNPL